MVSSESRLLFPLEEPLRNSRDEVAANSALQRVVIAHFHSTHQRPIDQIGRGGRCGLFGGGPIQLETSRMRHNAIDNALPPGESCRSRAPLPH